MSFAIRKSEILNSLSCQLIDPRPSQGYRTQMLILQLKLKVRSRRGPLLETCESRHGKGKAAESLQRGLAGRLEIQFHSFRDGTAREPASGKKGETTAQRSTAFVPRFSRAVRTHVRSSPFNIVLRYIANFQTANRGKLRSAR